MSEGVLSRYRKKLDYEIERIETYILNGKCKDHTDYIGRIGEVMAFRRAKENFQRSIKEIQLEDEAEEDNQQPSDNDSENDDE